MKAPCPHDRQAVVKNVVRDVGDVRFELPCADPYCKASSMGQMFALVLDGVRVVFERVHGPDGWRWRRE